MKMREDIRPVTYLKSRAADLLAQLNETHRAVIITQNGEARAVIQAGQAQDDAQRLRIRHALHKNPQRSTTALQKNDSGW